MSKYSSRKRIIFSYTESYSNLSHNDIDFVHNKAYDHVVFMVGKEGMIWQGGHLYTSYKATSTYINDAYAYSLKYIGDVQSYVTASYGYTLNYVDDVESYFNDVYTYTFSYINNAYSYTLNTTHKTYNNIISYIKQTSSDINNDIQELWHSYYLLDNTQSKSYLYLKNYINKVNTYVVNSYGYSLNYINNVNKYINNAYSYTLDYISNTYNDIAAYISEIQVSKDIENDIQELWHSYYLLDNTQSKSYLYLKNYINKVNVDLTDTISDIKADLTDTISDIKADLTDTISDIKAEIYLLRSALLTYIM